MLIPCYRVLLLDLDGLRWRPYVTRTRSLLRTLRELRHADIPRAFVMVERRPGKGLPMPFPPAPRAGIKLFVT